MLKGTWCRWHLGGERPVPTGGKGSLLFRESGSTDDILSNPYLSVQEQQFWCALRGERCLPLPRSITLQVSRGWCETHPCRQSPFPPVMKRSSQAAHLITADNSEWKSVELPASHHSVISRMCPQKVLRQHCRSPAPRATCLPLSLWGLLEPFYCTGLVLSTAAIFSAQRRDAEPIHWLFHLLLLERMTTKVSIKLHSFQRAAWTSPSCP